MSNLSEQATINFYQWEARGRGYLHFDKPVEIEPPYIPFIPVTTGGKKDVDDGRVPSFFNRVTNLFNSPKDEVEDVPDIQPHYTYSKSNLVALRIYIPHDMDVSMHRMHELLNLINFSQYPLSFELIAEGGAIHVQVVTHPSDSSRVRSHFNAFFPSLGIKEGDFLDIGFNYNNSVAIADFGLDEEYMLSIAHRDTLTALDPLTSIIATLDTIGNEDKAIIQILFKGVTAPWARDIVRASSDGQGGSFFEEYPEFISEAKEKISCPLFSVVMRIGAQGHSEEHSRYIAQELSRSITSISRSEHNQLIPLSNEGYSYEDHLHNIRHRMSNRLGFILNTKELAHFVHLPHKTVVSRKLRGSHKKTKQYESVSQEGICIGNNIHTGRITPVFLNTETRLSHTHIIGATGTGKSTLIVHMACNDIEDGRGCAVFDPHGDMVNDILNRIPEHRKNDVVLVDPSDIEYPIGFNLLEAHTETEKIVLSSDLVSAFKSHATAWGDNMTSVLHNAINTMLESSQGGTLIDLKRFLIEETFRKKYLATVNDPQLQYYWQREYPMLKKGISPLLTRIDTFLRPKTIRYMFAQRGGVDVQKCVQDNKIVLLKLSQGLIGEHNSYLLGSLFLSKFNQAALARQSQDQTGRTPYFLYIDEFQNFITPSIQNMLSGTRKYGMGLILAHQELGQLSDNSLLNTIISNPYIRICFRLGDSDARRLASGFSGFQEDDFLSLERGEALVRTGSQRDDFNLNTNPLLEVSQSFTQQIISHVRSTYAQPRAEVEKLLSVMFSHTSHSNKTSQSQISPDENQLPDIVPEQSSYEKDVNEVSSSSLEVQKKTYLSRLEIQEQEQTHRAIQSYILTVGQQRGFVVHLEVETATGGRIDATLQQDNIRIAVEVSVTNTIDYEIQNISKCFKEEYPEVYVISENNTHLTNIQQRAKERLSNEDFKRVTFGTPAQFMSYLNTFENQVETNTKRVRGYRVKSSYREINEADGLSRKEKIQDIILKSTKKPNKKD